MGSTYGFESSNGSAVTSAGGVGTAYCPILCDRVSSEEQHLVPGRCLSSSLLQGDRVLSVVKLHNYGLSRVEVKHIGTHLAHLHSTPKVEPCKFFNVLIGDLNIKVENEKSSEPGHAFEGRIIDRGYVNLLCL